MSFIDDAVETARIHDKLDSLDADFVIESIKKQLENPLDNNIKRNFLKRFENKYKEVKEEDNYDPEIDDQRELLHNDIIRKIADAYDLEISTDDVKIPKLAKNLYKFFVVDIIDNITQFLEMYLILHSEEISSIVSVENENVSNIAAKDSFDNENIANITSNIVDSIYAVADSNLSFDTFLDTLKEHPDSSGYIDSIIDYNNLIICQNSDLFVRLMEPILLQKEGYSNILTNIQIKLCQKFAK